MQMIRSSLLQRNETGHWTLYQSDLSICWSFRHWPTPQLISQSLWVLKLHLSDSEALLALFIAVWIYYCLALEGLWGQPGENIPAMATEKPFGHVWASHIYTSESLYFKELPWLCGNKRFLSLLAELCSICFMNPGCLLSNEYTRDNKGHCSVQKL